MLAAINLHGRDLLVVSILIGFVAFLGYRVLRKDPLSRIVRLGLFIERQRYASDETKPRVEEWSPDPLSEESEPRPAPLPPPTPPPPLPPRRDDAADDTEAWPQREERP